MKKITTNFIKKNFKDIQIIESRYKSFDGLSNIEAKHYKCFISFAININYFRRANANKNIGAIITDKETYNKIDKCDITIIISDEPKVFFARLHNYIYNSTKFYKQYEFCDYIIDKTATISLTSIISNHVSIGKNSIIKDRVIIKEGTIIGNNVEIREGAIIGPEISDEVMKDSKFISLKHDSYVKIGDNSKIGVGTTIARGCLGKPTEIGSGSRICDHVFVAHGVKIGNNTYIASGSNISGSARIGNNIWIGPSVTITNNISISDGASITIGSVVAKDVEKGRKITGNFAIDHVKFMKEWVRKLSH